MENNLDPRNEDDLVKAIAIAYHTVYKKYLEELEKYPLIQPTEVLLDESPEDCIRLLQLDQLTCKKGEDIFQKLSTVYHASMALKCNLVVMIDVDRISAPAKIYIGVKNSGEDTEARNNLATSFRTLKNELHSNFPGTCFHDVPSQNVLPELLREIFGKEVKNVSAVSCVASARDKTKTENKNFVQGLEKFIDAMQGNTYTALFIAEPIGADEITNVRGGYEKIYSTLSPFRKSVWTYNENTSEAVMESLSKGISKSVSEGTSHTQGHCINAGVNFGFNFQKNKSDTYTHSVNSSTSKPTGVSRVGAALQAVGSTVASIAGSAACAAKVIPPAAATAVPLKAIAGIATVVGGVGAAMQGTVKSESIADSVARMAGKSLGVLGGGNLGYTKSASDTTSKNKTQTNSETRTEGRTSTTGEGKSIQIENDNKSIEEMLKRIELQLKRVQEEEDYGAYSCAAYFLSAKQDTVLLASNAYRALMLGEDSSVESSAINVWDGNETAIVVAMKEYLRRFTHPIFVVPISDNIDDISNCLFYSPGTMVSGMELPLHLGLPTRSVYGLPVLEHAEFGRNITERNVLFYEDKRKINIGKIYHMGKIERNSSVELNLAGLTAHTFITGSTGSGKSNTIYRILDELDRQDVCFMVIEPAKGEYKKVFGNREDVVVYGTNPKIKETELIRINPFSFPENVHILEHLDRLVEIFNVCWPMYAAMPAILKDAIQRAYETAGWDVELSKNIYDNRIFPTFKDVYSEIRQVLEESDYSQDNKGDYTGSLVTRLRSLTTGINGLIFSSDEIVYDELFRSNAIIDLSRIGSTETKSLIMGLLILKLQEYYMSDSEPNQKLKHVTVLEESHNLLRKTSFEQNIEGSNLLGKSVEMLANSIAEMRTYGEGFIIADQAPGLLDMSVIRNTNTKIILRLPDYSDRELVGKAAGLNKEQIEELAELDNGVAAIRQSEWLETVLSKIDKFESKGDNTTKIKFKTQSQNEDVSHSVKQSLLECIMEKELYRKNDRVDIQRLKEKILNSKLDTSVKCRFIEYLSEGKEKAVEALQKLVYDFFQAEKAIQSAVHYSDLESWYNAVVEHLNPSVKGYSDQQIELLMTLVILEKESRDPSYGGILCGFAEKLREKGVQ